jgi:hypothetical protein
LERRYNTLNKTKKVAWHKHLRKDKKLKEKLHLAQKAGAGVVVPSAARR